MGRRWRGWAGACLLLLAGCDRPVSPEQRAATDLNPSGRPVPGPRLYDGYAPGTANAFRPLYCHLEGPGATCSRS